MAGDEQVAGGGERHAGGLGQTAGAGRNEIADERAVDVELDHAVIELARDEHAATGRDQDVLALLDAGVVLGLSWGAVTLVEVTLRTFRNDTYYYSPEVPGVSVDVMRQGL